MSDFETWGIVEVMGRKVFAGKLTEQEIAGTMMLRVDVPETPQRDGFTKFIGAGSLYSITPTDEATARLAAAKLNEAPISPYIIPTQYQLSAEDQGQAEPDYDNEWEDDDER